MKATTVWLVKPEVPRNAEGIAGMRRAIEQDAAHQSLIRECLDAARARGLSGEDTYVFLAYQALLRVQEMDQRHVYLSDVVPPIERLSQRPGAGTQIAAHLARLVRAVMLRTERAAAAFTRIYVGRSL